MLSCQGMHMRLNVKTLLLVKGCTHLPQVMCGGPLAHWSFDRHQQGFSPSPIAVTVPAQSKPGGPGSPGYIPSTFSTSLKFSP